MAMAKKKTTQKEGAANRWNDPAHLNRYFKNVPDFIRESGYFAIYLDLTDGGKNQIRVRPKDIWEPYDISRERGWSLLNRMTTLGLARPIEDDEMNVAKGTRLLVPLKDTEYASKKGGFKP